MPVAIEASSVNASTRRSGDTFNSERKRGRLQRQQQRRRPQREEKPERARDGGDQHALGEHLLNQTTPVCAERDAHRHFSPPARRLRQQQVGDVRAGDQQDEPDHRHQHRADAAGDSAER